MKGVSDYALTALVLGAGALATIQAVVNGRLGTQLASPFWASVMQNLVGTTVMFLPILLLRVPSPSAGQIETVPAWAWIGGALGATYVLCTLVATPRLGATRAMVAVITGQLIASVVLDHFGLLQARRPIDLRTLGGLVLLAGGAGLILARD